MANRKQPQVTDTERWERAINIHRLRAKGVTIPEIAKQYRVSERMVYYDIKWMRQKLAMFKDYEPELERLIDQYDEVIRAAWAAMPSADGREKAALMAKVNEAIAGKARVLGLDKQGQSTTDVKISNITVGWAEEGDYDTLPPSRGAAGLS